MHEDLCINRWVSPLKSIPPIDYSGIVQKESRNVQALQQKHIKFRLLTEAVSSREIFNCVINRTDPVLVSYEVKEKEGEKRMVGLWGK